MEKTIEITNFDSLKEIICDYCNDNWYCHGNCEILEKASKIDIDKINQNFLENNCNIHKTVEYIKLEPIKTSSII